THHALLAFLAQHPQFLAKVDVSTLRDEAVRTLVASAQKATRLDAPALLAECSPEIRDAVARALGSEEFVGGGNPQRTFESIVVALSLPSDLPTLIQVRSAAIERGDRELTEMLNARINAVRRSSR